MTRNLLLSAAAALVIASTAAGAFAQSGPQATDKTLGFGILGARVGGAGNLIEGYGAESAQRAGPGVYDVEFDRDIDQCVIMGTVTAAIRDITAFQALSNKNVRVITTVSTTGAAADAPFHLLVTCFE